MYWLTAALSLFKIRCCHYIDCIKFSSPVLILEIWSRTHSPKANFTHLWFAILSPEMEPAQTSLDERDSGVVATVTVQNPEKMNSLNSALLDALVESLDTLRKRRDLRCVVITGGPCTGSRQAFVAGADISELKDIRSAASGRAFITKLHLACKALREFPVPVIARINGYALGGGLLIATSTDLRVADSKALFGMPEVGLGVPSTIDSALLPYQIGALRARRLLLLGDTISARDAEQWGLVDKVVPTTDLDDAVEDWIQMFMKAGSKALKAQKDLLTTWEEASLPEAIQAGIWAFGRAFEDGPDSMSEGRRMMNSFGNQNKQKRSKL